MDRELVDAAWRPFDLDGEMGPVPFLRTEDETFVGLDSAPFALIRERPAPERHELDFPIHAPSSQQAADVGLDLLMVPWRHS